MVRVMVTIVVNRTREELKGRSYEEQDLLLVELTDQGWQALRKRGYQVDNQASIPSSLWSAGGRRGGRRAGRADLPPQLARAGAQVDRRDLHGAYSFKYQSVLVINPIQIEHSLESRLFRISTILQDVVVWHGSALNTRFSCQD